MYSSDTTANRHEPKNDGRRRLTFCEKAHRVHERRVQALLLGNELWQVLVLIHHWIALLNTASAGETTTEVSDGMGVWLLSLNRLRNIWEGSCGFRAQRGRYQCSVPISSSLSCKTSHLRLRICTLTPPIYIWIGHGREQTACKCHILCLGLNLGTFRKLTADLSPLSMVLNT